MIIARPHRTQSGPHFFERFPKTTLRQSHRFCDMRFALFKCLQKSGCKHFVQRVVSFVRCAIMEFSKGGNIIENHDSATVIARINQQLLAKCIKADCRELGHCHTIRSRSTEEQRYRFRQFRTLLRSFCCFSGKV